MHRSIGTLTEFLQNFLRTLKKQKNMKKEKQISRSCFCWDGVAKSLN